jgi:serine/threonine protein kinase/tetratricopeptide (TPR) repeat protein
MADRVGQQLDNYRLIRLLGAGGFAEVYLAEHVYRKTLVAIKMLPQLAQDDLQGFLNEARTFRLKHPNIMQVLDFGVKERGPFIVMEYAPNGTLRQRHPHGSRVPLSTVVSYVMQVASALQYAHDEGLIHRDVKPENMLVGERNEILLSDFGIATMAHGTTSTNEGAMVGTVVYMAPEQIQGRPRRASDQYALGLVVYEWLCGDRPFHGSLSEIVVQQLQAPPPPLHEKAPEISPAVERVVLAALAKDPKERFVSVQDFAEALKQASKFTQSTSMLPSSTPSPLATPDSITPTDVISMLPTAPIIPSATQPQEASPLPPSVPPTSPPAAKEQQPPVALPGSWMKDLQTVRLPLEPPVSPKEQILPVAPSIDKCPYCGAKTQLGEIFCLNCGNRLLSAPPLSQQVQPIIGGDATQQAFGPDSNDRAVADRKGRPESLIGSLLAPSVISPWKPDLDAPSVIVPEPSVSSPPPTDAASTVAADKAKEQELKEGDTYYRARRYEEALAVYERVIRMNPHNARAYSNKGNALRKLKRYKEALEAYERALTIDPNSAFVWISEGKVFYSLKRYDEALVAYSRALVINPNDAVTWASKGNVLYALRRYREALEAYDSALIVKSDDASIWSAKGEVLYRQKRYREALEAYDRALAITPDDASIWIAKGNKLYKLKRYKEVLATYERILAITPNNVSIWSNKGNVLYQAERYDEALDAYNKALTITPRKARIWSDKGAVLYKLERYDEALEAYKFAQFLDPNDTSISHRYDMLRDRLRDLKRRQEEPERKQAPGQSKFEAPSSNDRPASSPGSGQPSYAVPLHQEKKAVSDQPIYAISPRQEKNAEAKKAAGSKQFDVFLSHSHTDAEWVEKNLALRLVDEHGFRVWLDKWMLIPGQSFVQGMARGIDQAHCCAVCIGEHTPLGWFKQEIQRALNRQAKDPSFRVFAILLPGAKDVYVDDFLELNIWVDFRSSDTAYAFHVLVSGVKGEPPGRWPPKETLTMKTSADVEAKLRELHRFKQENWVDPSIAVEFQRTILKKLWLDFDESEEQQE